MSIIRADVEEMRKNSEKLGIGELYGLFACMVSGRSWNAILGGIDKQGKTATEAKEIKNDAAKYVVSHSSRFLYTRDILFLLCPNRKKLWKFFIVYREKCFSF